MDEIKTHQGGRQLVLRSQYPDGVEQEIYGFTSSSSTTHCGASCTRRLAKHASIPTGSSFTRTLNAARRHVTAQAALSPLTTQPSPDTHHP
ncbi:hypothetical protein OG462_43100 [Streptomyces sp. NBC_01077]|nr:hypothetical protein OG462_01905 [Streptomyces sp. NBC_01077]WSV44342.1 hypothetical protein OG462_43100 [Streptomyces sp. NBC_01077]